MPTEHEEGLISRPVPLLDEWTSPGSITTAAPCGVDAVPTAADGLATLLARAEGYFGELWPERESYVARLGELRARLAEQRLQIAVLGQFKRGKSTFLNALLGEPLLPTGVLPLTAVPTFIRWAPAPEIAVTYLDGRTEKLPASEPAQITGELFRLVTEEGNPHNQAKIARVDLSSPAPVLDNGIVLIDTPGIGSTFRHNTDTALGVLPACDAGFFVLSADPPVTPVELEYLDRVRVNVARLFYILNKIDYLSESDRISAVEFLRRSLGAHMPSQTDIPIFTLSARRGLEAKQGGDSQGVADSGLAEIERYLAQFLAREKTEALHRAIAGKFATLLDTALMDVGLGVRALEMPIEDLEARATQFRDALREIERQRLVARDLVAGDRRRAAERLEARAEALRDEARSVLGGVLDRALGSGGSGADLEQVSREAIAVAIPDFFAPKLGEVSGAFAGEVEAMLTEHVRRAEALIASVRETAATLFEIPSMPPEGADSFVMAREPFWVTQKWDQTIGSLAGGSLDRLLPTTLRVARIKIRLTTEVGELVQRNVENLRWATLQNLDDAFRRFSGWFDDRIAEAIGATRGAIETALAKRREHAEQAQDDLTRLREAAKWITAAQRDLGDLQRPLSPDGRSAEMLAPAQEK
jgi:GTP-binding protein EngB required for normal cell division